MLRQRYFRPVTDTADALRAAWLAVMLCDLRGAREAMVRGLHIHALALGIEWQRLWRWFLR